jgi:Holliday junction resolvase RusA-like endonuclease
MTQLDRDYAVRVYGLPAPKGSMKCVGKNGRHQLVEQLAKTVTPWRALVVAAGKALPVSGLVGPIGVEVTFTVPRPKTVPLSVREWPTVARGDLDKMCRLLLDGLEDAGLYGNDSQVVDLHAVKAYPDTPGATDRLDRPGAVIRIFPIGG